MRQAINSLQATFTGFGAISREYVFKVCDVPNIDVIKKVLQNCIDGDFSNVNSLFKMVFISNRLKEVSLNYMKKGSQHMTYAIIWEKLSKIHNLM